MHLPSYPLPLWEHQLSEIIMKLYPIWNENSHGPACGSADIHTWMSEGQCPNVIVGFQELSDLLEKLDNLGLTEISGYLRETSTPNEAAWPKIN